MSETKVEIIAAKEVSAVMSHPKSCMCEICQPGSGMVYSPEGSSGAEQRIAALEEQLQIRDAEIHLLKESRAAAVSQEQSSRVECNELRSIVASAQERIMGLERRVDNQKSFIERFACCLDGLPINHIGGSLIDGTRDAGSIRTIVDTLLKQLAEAQAACAAKDRAIAILRDCAYWRVQLTLPEPVYVGISSTCGQGWKSPEEYERLRRALMNLWNKGPDCPGVQGEVEAALKGQP